MGFLAIVQLIMAIPGLIKAFFDIMSIIRGMDDGKEKDRAKAKFEDIKASIVREKKVSEPIRSSIIGFRDYLAERRSRD